MILAHRIALDPTNVQATYFAKACGVARLAYNWGLAEWREQYAIGGKPSERELRRLFNSIKDERFPFVREVTKCAPQLALMNLGAAFKRFFAGQNKYPAFKKKGVHDSFEIDNDEFEIRPYGMRVPKLGWVRMREALRFVGKIISATISRTAGRWFASIAVEIADPSPVPHKAASVGIDFGCTTFATLSTGEKIEGSQAAQGSFGSAAPTEPLASPKGQGQPQPLEGQGQAVPSTRPDRQRPRRLPAQVHDRYLPSILRHRDRGPERQGHEQKPRSGPVDPGRRARRDAQAVDLQGSDAREHAGRRGGRFAFMPSAPRSAARPPPPATPPSARPSARHGSATPVAPASARRGSP
jgi:hypothetical protein